MTVATEPPPQTTSSPLRAAVAAPEFGDNSYLTYKVTADGTADSQSHTTLAASSCEHDGGTWSISNHTLSYDDDVRVIAGDASCNYLLTPAWTLIDNGETAEWSIVMTFSADPEQGNCAALDQAIVDASPNGEGLLGCTVTLDVSLDFEKVEAP